MAPSNVSAIRKIVNNVNEETRRRKIYMHAQGYYTAAEVRAMKRANTNRAPSSSSDSSANQGTHKATTASSSASTSASTAKHRVTKSPATKKAAKRSSDGASIAKRLEQFEIKAAKQADRLNTMKADEVVVQSSEKHDSAVDDDSVAPYSPQSPPTTSTLSSAPTDCIVAPGSIDGANSNLPARAATVTPQHPDSSGPQTASATVKLVKDNSATAATTPSDRPVRCSRAVAVAKATWKPRCASANWVAAAAEDPFGLFDDEEESDDDEWSKGVHRAG